MTLADTARAHYAVQASLSQRAAAAALVLWAELDAADMSGSWASLRLGERLFVALATMQLSAAVFAARYVAAALAWQGAPSAPLATVAARAFAGVTADGRDLETLLYSAVVRAKLAAGAGADPRRALQVGGSSLATIASTQVADAGRAAVGAAMMVEPSVTGWVRMLTPPSCGRCAILAGRRYRVAAGFNRHPRCNCVAIPAVEDRADDLRTDPKAYFASLTRAAQDRYFGVAATAAVLGGTDLARVVNATGSTSVAGLERRGGRVTPEGIYAAAPDRDTAVEQLRRNGFVT